MTQLDGGEETFGSTKEFPFTDADFKDISQRVMGLTGIVLRDEKKTLVYSRLAKRLRALQLSSFSDYCKLLQKREGTSEISLLINAITTNLTRFFREEHHFEHIKNTVLPALVERYKQQPTYENRRLRFWSAGCSSGEEPYSLAMTIAAHLPSGFDVKILATDIDTNMLQKGREALYIDSSGIPDPYYKAFCIPLPGGGFKIQRPVCDLITFKQLNLLDEWPMSGPFQAIFCRNVVIYFNKGTQTKIFNKMVNLIEPHGWLYIGHSESLFKICDRFELKGRTIYRQGSQR